MMETLGGQTGVQGLKQRCCMYHRRLERVLWVQVALGEEHLLARITRRSAEALALEPGVAVHAVVKTVSVAQSDIGQGRG